MLKKTGNQDIFECKCIFFNEILGSLSSWEI